MHIGGRLFVERWGTGIRLARLVRRQGEGVGSL